MQYAEELKALLCADPQRLHLIALVHTLRLPDCWIGAGFVRNAVWDLLHGRAPSPPAGDVDVIWFDASRNGAEIDRQLENRLRALDDTVTWSVKNQSRMHIRNDDAPYLSSSEAMHCWPETATAVAVRHSGHGCHGELELAAPFGLDDLYRGVVRPTPRFACEKRPLFEQRVQDKDWLRQWPLLRLEKIALP